MSFRKFFNNLREIEVDLAWCHWNRLGVSGRGSSTSSGRSNVNRCSTDPEALVLLTSIIGKHDLRLVEVMNEWLWNYESLVSIERLKRYTKELQAEKSAKAGTFNVFGDSITHLNTNRWQSISDLIGGKQPKNFPADNQKSSRKKLEAHDDIVKNNRQLFLRLMFGVGSRADIIYYAGVVSNQEKNPFDLKISAPHITRMLHYNNSSIFRTLCDLEQAGVLVINPKTMGCKNKVYLPNIRIKGSKDIFGIGSDGEKAFIDWFAVVKICLLIESLERNFEGIREDSIIKSRLYDFITSCSALMMDGCIDIKNSFSTKALYPALIHVGLDELQSKAIALIDGMAEFVTAKRW